MTKLLKKALARVSKLSEHDQDFIAQIILDELKSESRWTKLFAQSKNELRALAEEARKDVRAGRTYSLNFDNPPKFDRRGRRAK